MGRRPKWTYEAEATNNDEEVMGIDGVFEWVVEHPMDIRPYAVLVRDRESIANKRTILEMAEDAINGHRAMQPGRFDCIPGKIDTAAQEAAEQMQMSKMDRGKHYKTEISREAGLWNLRNPED